MGIMVNKATEPWETNSLILNNHFHYFEGFIKPSSKRRGRPPHGTDPKRWCPNNHQLEYFSDLSTRNSVTCDRCESNIVSRFASCIGCNFDMCADCLLKQWPPAVSEIFNTLKCSSFTIVCTDCTKSLRTIKISECNHLDRVWIGTIKSRRNHWNVKTMHSAPETSLAITANNKITSFDSYYEIKASKMQEIPKNVQRKLRKRVAPLQTSRKRMKPTANNTERFEIMERRIEVLEKDNQTITERFEIMERRVEVLEKENHRLKIGKKNLPARKNSLPSLEYADTIVDLDGTETSSEETEETTRKNHKKECKKE